MHTTLICWTNWSITENKKNNETYSRWNAQVLKRTCCSRGISNNFDPRKCWSHLPTTKTAANPLPREKDWRKSQCPCTEEIQQSICVFFFERILLGARHYLVLNHSLRRLTSLCLLRQRRCANNTAASIIRAPKPHALVNVFQSLPFLGQHAAQSQSADSRDTQNYSRQKRGLWKRETWSRVLFHLQGTTGPPCLFAASPNRSMEG